MEDINQPQSAINDTVPANKMHHTIWRVLVIALIVIVAALLVWFGYVLWKKHHHPVRTPQQALNDLQQASYNDGRPDDQKAAIMDTLEKGSRPNPMTKDDQLQTLNALRQ